MKEPNILKESTPRAAERVKSTKTEEPDQPTKYEAKAMFASLMSRAISANEQCFSLTTNQRTVLSTMPFQRSE